MLRAILVCALAASAFAAPTWTQQLATLKTTMLADVSAPGISVITNNCGSYQNAYTPALLFDGQTPTSGYWGWNPTSCSRNQNNWYVKVNLGAIYSLTGDTLYTLGDTTHDPTAYTIYGCSSSSSSTSDCGTTIKSCSQSSGTTSGQTCSYSGTHEYQYVLFKITATATGWQPYCRELTFHGSLKTISPTQSPTETPTLSPTWTPTETPTTKPPSPSPSHTPTEHPTAVPTHTPTETPTVSPTSEVTNCHCTGCHDHYATNGHVPSSHELCHEQCVGDSSCKFALFNTGTTKCYLYNAAQKAKLSYQSESTATAYSCYDKA